MDHDERDQKEKDPHATHDVRNHGDRTGEIARVGPDQTYDRSHDEQGDRHGKGIEDPSGSDAAILASRGLGREGLRPAERPADPVVRLPGRSPIAGLERPVRRRRDAEPPGRLLDHEPVPLAIAT
jgi:hypothetical protein